MRTKATEEELFEGFGTGCWTALLLVIDHLVEVANEHVVGFACRAEETQLVFVEKCLRGYVGRSPVAVSEALCLRYTVRE